MKIPKKMGRPVIEPYYKYLVTTRLSQFQVDELKLITDEHFNDVVKRLVNEYISANGGKVRDHR